MHKYCYAEANSNSDISSSWDFFPRIVTSDNYEVTDSRSVSQCSGKWPNEGKNFEKTV